MAFDYMHPPEDFEYLGEWCKAWRDPATGDWTISQLLDGLDTEQIILSGEEVRELARLAAQHDPTDYELEYGELRRPMFASPDENGTAVNAAEGAGGVPLRPAGLRRPVAPVRVARGLRDWRTGSRVLAGGDRHVYDNHVDQFLEQLGREPYPYPTIEIRKADSLFDYQYEDFKVVGYQHRPIIKTPVAV